MDPDFQTSLGPSQDMNFGMVANQKLYREPILVKKNDTLRCEKKKNFFFKTPEFWYGRELILVKKMTLQDVKKKQKKKFQKFFFQKKKKSFL